jgi:4-hydroxy 2-oxovalerate aldolase
MALGAGAGNAQLECLVPVLCNEFGFDEEIYAFDTFIEMSALIEREAAAYLPRTTGASVVSGLAGVFSGYAPQVRIVSESLNIEPHLLWKELGARKVVAGQESIIWEIARDLMELS